MRIKYYRELKPEVVEYMYVRGHTSVMIFILLLSLSFNSQLIAQEALIEIKAIYVDHTCENNVELVIHEGGHEIEPQELLTYFSEHL